MQWVTSDEKSHGFKKLNRQMVFATVFVLCKKWAEIITYQNTLKLLILLLVLCCLFLKK
jgi:hypothetical protein